MAQQWQAVEGAAKNDAGEYQALVGGKWQPATGAAKSEDGKYMALMDAPEKPGLIGRAVSAVKSAVSSAPEVSVMDSRADTPAAQSSVQFDANSGLSTVSSRAQDVAVNRAMAPKADGEPASTMAATSEYLKGSGSPRVAEQNRVHPKPEVGLANAVEASSRYVDNKRRQEIEVAQNGGSAGDTVTSLKKGIEQIPGTLTGLADIPAALMLGTRPFSDSATKWGELTGFEPGKWADDASDEYSKKYQDEQRAIDQAWKNKDKNGIDVASEYLKNIGYSAQQIATSMPSMIAGGLLSKSMMVAGRVAPVAADVDAGIAARAGAPGALERAVGEKWAAPVAGGAGEGSIQAGQQMQQGESLKDQRKNAIAAVGSGVIDAVIGMGAGRLAEHFGLETAETAMAKAFDGNIKQSLSLGEKFGRSGAMAGGAASEGVLQELPQSAQEQVWQNYAEGKPLYDGVKRQAIEGAIAGFTMGGAANINTGSSKGKVLGQALQDSVDNTQLDPRSVTADALRALSPTGSLPVPLTKMAAEFSASQKAKATGVPYAVIAHPEDPAKFTAVPEPVAQDIAQKTQPISIQNGNGISADEILGAGVVAQEPAMSADDAAMLQGAQEQGVTLQEDHIGITPESLDNLFASQRAQHATAITQQEVMNGANITPAAPGLAVDPAIAASTDTFGGQPDSLRGNEGGINATGDRLAGHPAPGAEQADAGRAGTDNAVVTTSGPIKLADGRQITERNDKDRGIVINEQWGEGSKEGTELWVNGGHRVTTRSFLRNEDGTSSDKVSHSVLNEEGDLIPAKDANYIGKDKSERPYQGSSGKIIARLIADAHHASLIGDVKEHDRLMDRVKDIVNGKIEPVVSISQSAPTQKKAPAASENLLTRIKQLGGINLSHIRDVTGESNPKNVRAVGLFSKTGKGLDDLAVMLHDDGFDVGMHDQNDNGGVNRLSDQIRSALDGGTVLTMAATERKATADVEAEHNHNIKEQAKALGIKTVARKMAAIEADVIAKQNAINSEKELALRKELEKLSVDLDAALLEAQSLIGEAGISAALRHAGEFIENNDITDERAQIRAMISAVQSEITLRNQHDEIQDTDARQVTEGIAGQSDRAGGIQAGNGENREGESGSGFELTGQTPEELKAATEAEGRAREADAQETARQIREERNAADASVKASNVLNGNAADSFSLSAPEPVSKAQQKAIDKKKAEAEMHGQVDLLSQPAAESKPADKITLMAVSNKPFPTERAAQSSIKQRKLDATVVPVEGGFGIKHAPEQAAPEDSQKAGAETSQNADQAAREKADTDFDDAMSDLGDIFGKNFRATFTPEQEQKIIPVLTRLFDAAFRKGYYKFKDAARFVLDSISIRIGKEVADEITIDHLQGAYIGMAGRYKEQGADSKRDVVAFESKDELGESNVTDKRSGTGLERDSENTNTSDGVGAQGVRDGRNGDGGAGRQGVLDTEGEGGARRSDGISGRNAASDGERGNLEIYTGAPANEASIARDSVNQRSDSAGVDGPPIESDATSVAEELAESGISLEEARSEQRTADKQEHKPGIENIRATLPILTEAQQDDVAIAETRFAKPDGYGMLFTNGTGTGKTFTGLGIIKRFVMDGKSNIIITAPNDKIADDWKKAGRLLGLDITRLPDTKSAGSGVVIATYANFGQNNELAKRNWDLIVHDEAHYLAMDKDGTNTLSLHNLRAISMNPAGASTRASMLHADLIETLAKVRGDIKSARESGDDRSLIKLPPLEAKEKALAEKFRAAVESVKSDVASKQGVSRPRVLFLSATPFAYEKTVDWANGYLFDYNEGRGNEGSESRGYNAGSNRDQFMMQNFGYRMRYGKLTAPDAKVDSGLMQRQFNTMLKKSGVLSGRMLDVKADYDRRFVLVDSAIGRRIDAALQWFEDQRAGGKDESSVVGDKEKARTEALRDLRDLIGEKFDYLSRRYLLEAIKAEEVIPHIKEHMALGRKVVVFHDYKKGGGFNPFDIHAVKTGDNADPARANALNSAIREFRAEFKDLIESDVWHASSPITAFQQAFSGTTHPKVLLFNGDVSAKDRRAAVEKFQDDASGPQVILVQSAAGKEGISLHDTTGKHQRVLFNLGQPTQPTTAIQQEGRIYRTGQATDAIFRYMNTGTNWEKWAFATTIAHRASAAENLGMGEQARALKDAFITGFEESDDYRAGMDGEGRGGKERDKAANNALTEYDRARSFYFGTQKKNSRTKAQEGADYFATPEPVGLKMVELADIRPGESALEPSAGHGAIARWMPTTVERSAIEPSTVLRPRLAMVFDGKIIGSDFEDMHVSNKFDAIVMNPPFGVGGKTAIEHLAKAATHLRDGGRIVALIPQGPMADKRFDNWMYEKQDRKIKPVISGASYGDVYKGDIISTRASWAKFGRVDSVDANGMVWVKVEGSTGLTAVTTQSITGVESLGKRTESYSPSKGFHLVADIKLPSVTFERAGTAVNTRIVVIEKSDNAPQQATRDYSNVADINELFDRMESLSIPPRAKAVEVIEEPAPQKRESKVAALDAQAKEKEADAVSSGQIAASSTDATFEIKNGKLVTNAPTEKVITGKGKELEGVFVPFDKLTQAQIKEADAFTYMPKGKASGWFVRLRHVERPSTGLAASNESPVFSHEEAAPIPESEWLSDGAIAQIVEDRLSQFKHQPKILIRGRVSDILGNPARNSDSIPGGVIDAGNDTAVVSGMVHAGKIHLFKEGMGSTSAVTRTLWHELLHYGIRRFMTKEQYIASMQKLYSRDAWIKEKADAWVSTPDADEAKKSGMAYARARGVDEALADISEKNAGENINNGVIAKTIRSVTTWAADLADRFGFTDAATKLRGVSSVEAKAFVSSVFGKLRNDEQAISGKWDFDADPAFARQQPIGLNTPVQPGSSIPDETEFQKRQRQVQDKMNRFSVLQKWLKDKGVSLSEKADVHANENLMHAKIANQTQDFRDHVETPLIERAAKAGFKLADIADYLEAQHIPEANKRMRDIHHDGNATANGITDAEANQALADFQAMPKFAEFKKLADDFRSIGDETLNLRLREGLISRDQYDAYKNTYQHWVPLRGDGKKPGVGKGLSVNAKEKRRLGHGQREDGEMIIENLLMDRERAIYQVEHNRVGKSIIQFALEAKEPDMITVGKPEKRQILKDQNVFAVHYKGQVIRAFSTEADAKSFIAQAVALSTSRPGGGMARSNFAIAKSNDPMVVMQASPMLAENEIQVYVAGHTIRVQLNDELLARAATNMGVDQVNSLLAAGRTINNGLSKIYTAYSPDFIFRNAIRDFIAGTINLTGDMGVKMAGKIYANYGRAAKELFVARNDPRKSAWVQRYRAAGGNTGAAYLSDIERIGADAQAAMYEHMKGMAVYHSVHHKLISEGRNQVYAHTAAAMKTGVAKFSSIPVLGHFLSLIEHLNAVTENALRLATYMTLVQNGYTEQKAAVAAKNSTVNFNRKGEISNVMGAAYLFFNPSVQGSTRMFSSLLKSEHKGQAQAMAGMLAFAAFALAELGRGGDDDDERKWKNIPDHVKDHNLIFKFGDLQYTIPVPYEFAPFHVLGNSISNAVHGESGWKSSMKVLKSLVDNLSPLGDPFAGEGKDGANLFQITPTVVKIVLAPHENQNSFASPIQPEKNSFSKNKPDSQNMFRNTAGTTYAGAAEWVNEMTGGSKYRAGGVDVSPEVLKFWVSTLTGGTGRFAIDMYDAAKGSMEGVAPDLKNTPIARVFVRESSVTDARARFWEAANEAKVAADELAMAKKDHNGSAVKEIRDAEGDMVRLSKMADRMGKAASKKRDAIDAIRQDDQMPLDQKREQMKAIEQKEQEYYDRFLKMFDQKEKARRDRAA